MQKVVSCVVLTSEQVLWDDTCVYTTVENGELLLLHCSSLEDNSVAARSKSYGAISSARACAMKGQGNVDLSSMIYEARWSSNVICLTEPPKAALSTKEYSDFTQAVR